MAKLQGDPGGDGGGSARSGCTMMGAALGMFALVVGVGLWSLFSQDRAIAAFTLDVQMETDVAQPGSGDVAALEAKLDSFSMAAAAGEEVELTLTLDDLNLIVATTEAGKDYRGMVYFKGTRALSEEEEGGESNPQGRQIVGDICLTMNKLKFWEKRYLIGEMDFDLRVVPAGLDLVVTAVRVPGKEVPEQFVGSFANWHWLSPFHEDPAMKKVFTAIREVEVLDDSVVFRAGKPEAAGENPR